jgi:hypothetical protein
MRGIWQHAAPPAFALSGGSPDCQLAPSWERTCQDAETGAATLDRWRVDFLGSERLEGPIGSELD